MAELHNFGRPANDRFTMVVSDGSFPFEIEIEAHFIPEIILDKTHGTMYSLVGKLLEPGERYRYRMPTFKQVDLARLRGF